MSGRDTGHVGMPVMWDIHSPDPGFEWLSGLTLCWYYNMSVLCDTEMQPFPWSWVWMAIWFDLCWYYNMSVLCDTEMQQQKTMYEANSGRAEAILAGMWKSPVSWYLVSYCPMELSLYLMIHPAHICANTAYIIIMIILIIIADTQSV